MKQILKQLFVVMVVAFFVATFVSCASSKTVDEIPQEDVWTPVSDLSDLTGTFVGEIQIKAVGDGGALESFGDPEMDAVFADVFVTDKVTVTYPYQETDFLGLLIIDEHDMTQYVETFCNLVSYPEVLFWQQMSTMAPDSEFSAEKPYIQKTVTIVPKEDVVISMELGLMEFLMNQDKSRLKLSIYQEPEGEPYMQVVLDKQ